MFASSIRPSFLIIVFAACASTSLHAQRAATPLQLPSVYAAIPDAPVMPQSHVAGGQSQAGQGPSKIQPTAPIQQAAQVAPLTPKQKFALFGKFTVDPLTFIETGVVAGVEQAAGIYSGFGDGAQDYGRRYGTTYADFFTADFLGEALLPVLLKQDPRYFYKGEGTKGERTLYAVSNSVLCRGDNHQKQVNYSRLLGDFASGGLSNLYYPASSRDGIGLTFYNFGFAIGAQVATNLVQEFFLHKSTSSP